MSYLFSQILPSLKALKILRKTDQFEYWLKSMHGIKNDTQIFEGYLYAISCCINAFLDGLSSDYQLKIKNDLLFERAIHELIPLHKIENSCEKTIFLKRLKPYVKSILRSGSYREVSKEIKRFDKNISIIFGRINEAFVTVNPRVELKKSVATKLSLLNFVHTYLIQINNNGPAANFFNPISVEWTKESRKNYFLEGYKYAIQFISYKLLGKKKFNNTSLVNLHLVDSWREYKYQEPDDKADPMLLGREFNLEEQNSLDSYFYRIKEEITDGLGKKYNLPIYTIDSYFKFHPRNYRKKLFFSYFLNSDDLENTFNQLSFEDKIRSKLYWYPFEVINARDSKMHFGVPSFITMLAGTIALHNKKESEFPKIIVAKFIHPHPKERYINDYSYGILIDTKSATGHYNSGWVIYQNACGDYSGFSGSEHRATEKLIKEYKKNGAIELRELVIPLEKFQEFSNQSTLNKEQINILDQYKLIPDIIQKSRAHCFELFTYYLNSKFHKDRFKKISLNTDKNSITGEKDVVLENDDEVIVIECKLNPNNQNVNEIIDKLKGKLADYSQKRKSFELWFWNEPSSQNEMIFKEHNLKPVILSMPKGEMILKNVDLKLLKFIMQDYEIKYKSV